MPAMRMLTAAMAAATALAVACVCCAVALAAPADRPAALAAYDSVKQDVAVASGWTGSTDPCNVGTESQESLAATLHTVNTVRDFAGLAPVSFDDTANHKALAAALIMTAEGNLSHNPPPEWKCYSEDGRDGAGSSNLALGASGASAVLVYADDSGVDGLGHRRWLLDPSKNVFGSGSTGSANALYVLTGPGVAVPPGTSVAWPPGGWFPRAWIPAEWSVSVGGSGQNVEFQNPQVSMTLDGAPIAVADVKDNGTGFGTGRALSWRPDLAALPAGGDHELAVSVSGAVADGQPVPVSYTVKSFASSPPPPPPPPPSGDTLRFLARPTIARKGRVRKGTRLAAKAQVAGGSITGYRWLRDGRRIKRGTKGTYKVRAADRGHRLSCRVTATAADGGKLSRTTRSVRVRRR